MFPLIPENIKRNVTYLAILLAVVVLSTFLYKLFAPAPPAPTMAYQAALPAHGMEKAPTHDVVMKAPLKVIDKVIATKKMKLPELPPEKEILTTSSLKPSAGGYTTATIVDTQTGVSTTVVREEPRSVFQFGGISEIGVRGGLSTKGQQAAIYARQDVLRVGGVHLAGYGEVNAGIATPEAKAMVDIRYRW